MQANKKRKATSEDRPARRALSCTECKRRKTKCSALGKVPCDSCLKRGKPEDCRWEGMESEPIVPPPHEAHAANIDQVDALKQQVDRLENLVNTLTNKQTSFSLPHRSPLPDHQYSSSSSDLETAAIDLEHLVVGPGIRPGITETLGSPSKHPQRPPNPSPFPLSSLFSSASFDPDLITVLPQLLPNSPISQKLVESFFEGPIHYSWHVIARPAFESRLREYSTLSLDQLEIKVDPIWFALYLMVLSLSVKFATADQSPLVAATNAQSSDLPTTLYHASIKALQKSDYLSRPQVGHIQVSILYILFLFHFGQSTDQSSIALRHLDSAITTAQWLELDGLQDTLPSSLVQHPALAGLSPRHALEICKQLYHLLKFMDGTIFKRPGLWRLARNDDTPLPRNNDDGDYLYTAEPAAKSVDQMTEASLSRIGSSFVDTIRSFTSDQNLTLHQIITYDTSLRSVLGLMPSLPDSQNSWMMRTLQCSILYRLIRLHRPTLLRGYKESTWKFSSSACVDSAKVILRVQRDISLCPDLRPAFMRRWIMGSVIVLAIHTILTGDQAQEVLEQVQRSCIGTFAELLLPITAILNTAGQYRQHMQDSRTNLDINQFFTQVKDKLSSTGGDVNNTQQNGSDSFFDLDYDFNFDFDFTSIPNLDMSALQNDPGSSTGSWENMQWGLI
uniref:Zn(2)-C6 fungal-type domain-containing protein n=1 Tax=Kwoniella bestiolae CBS 10118 TaxID=1296100 RepID=A0A1B9FV94_9TREE|nr:hypothetical protein I302_08332 [Kwoniella bestiolae CBS 10118]OCF22681.1 hypothetical protein I302_08332 [Kwoniella bestiolae CBS 10118]